MAPAGRHLFLIHHHRIRSLLLTFLAYSSFHASRKPPSIVKSVLAPDHLNSAAPFTSGWPPFDGSHGPHRLGELDLAFLSAYSAGMYLSGHAADRLDLRLFLAGGMLGSCVATAAFGFAYWLDVHRLWFFIAVQVAGGLAQSIGWPCVVAVVANWFGDSSNRGLIMGIWNSHTSVGNILGSVLASCVLDFGWGWSFVLPALLVGLVGVLILTFLVPHPRDLGLDDMDEGTELSGENQPVAVSADGFAANLNGKDTVSSDETGLLLSDGLTDGTPEGRTEGGVEPIGFFEAWRLPGVASYACCLFFSKLVAYTFLYWLPFYIRHTAVAGKRPTHSTAGILSIVFDIGGVAGGISAGLASDRLGARAITSVAFLALSLPVLVLYRTCGGTSMAANTGLMCLCGFLINGPYSLITTAVSADLGLAGDNSRALATITAIIDGTGTVGAALGPLLTGYISSAPGGWTNVFLMLIVSNSLAIACLLRTAKAEVDSLRAVSSAAVVDAEGP